MCGSSHWQAARSKSKTSFATLDETGLVVAGCRHVIALKAVNMFAGEQYGYALYLHKQLSETVDMQFVWQDIMCKYWPWLKRVCTKMPEMSHLLLNSKALSVMHAKAHSLDCQMGKSSSKMSPSEMKDLISNTHFKENELKTWYSGFIKDCPDGLLNREQFIDLYSSFYGSENAKRFASHVFRTFDINGDGKIDFREFMCSLSVATRGSIEEKLRWAFTVYDIDGDGFISESEMKAIIRSIQKMKRTNKESALKIMRIFKEIDKDNDGQLSLSEFLEGAKKDTLLIQIMELGNLSGEDDE